MLLYQKDLIPNITNIGLNIQKKWGRAQLKELNKHNIFYKYIIYNEKYKEVWGIKVKA